MVSIVYYTANMEDEVFEQKIRDNISKANLPIISVSRKPIDFGKNICIGEQPVCYSNLWKQLLIGLKEAKTEFCIAAESDCLYPPEYFTFIPPTKDMVYRYGNVWVYWKSRTKFWKKPRCEGAQMCCREYWIERLEYILRQNLDHWRPMEQPNKMVARLFKKEGWWTGRPVITFKTDRGISGKTSMVKISPVTRLPYWGTSEEVRKKYL